MASVSKMARINASADAVWEVVRDFGGVAKWIGPVTGCTMAGEGVGAVRTVTLEGGAEVQERLEALDDGARSLSYAIVSSPLPIENYLSTIQVSAASDDECEVAWSSTFDVAPADEAEMKTLVAGVYTAGFEGLKKLLGG